MGVSLSLNAGAGLRGSRASSKCHFLDSGSLQDLKSFWIHPDLGSTWLLKVRDLAPPGDLGPFHPPLKPSIDDRTFCLGGHPPGFILQEEAGVLFFLNSQVWPFSSPTNSPGSHPCGGGAGKGSPAAMLGTHRINTAHPLPSKGPWPPPTATGGAQRSGAGRNPPQVQRPEGFSRSVQTAAPPAPSLPQPHTRRRTSQDQRRIRFGSS